MASQRLHRPSKRLQVFPQAFIIQDSMSMFFTDSGEPMSLSVNNDPEPDAVQPVPGLGLDTLDSHQMFSNVLSQSLAGVTNNYLPEPFANPPSLYPNVDPKHLTHSSSLSGVFGDAHSWSYASRHSQPEHMTEESDLSDATGAGPSLQGTGETILIVFPA